MEEKDIKDILTPGIQEALHPAIGNGVSFVENDHDFILLSPDPTKVLEGLLPENKEVKAESNARMAIKEVVTEKAEARIVEGEAAFDKVDAIIPKPAAPLKEEKPEDQKASEDGEAAADKADSTTSPPQPSKTTKPKSGKAVIKTVKKKKQPVSDLTNKEALPIVEKELPKKEPDDRKAPKPGKRIRKAAKAVQKQQKDSIEPVKKETAKKASVKKVPAKKAPVGKAPTKKTSTKSSVVKKSSENKAPVHKGFSLSPFTQWLKELGGADYVHPYDDDFALSQEKGALKEVISETYANLLAVQGYKERAIEMYLKLIEKYPEKSSFFAAKIEALQ